MKYLQKKFSSPVNSKAFVENWESVFGERKPAPRECGDCGALESEPCERRCSLSVSE